MTYDPLCWHATTYGPPCDCCALIARVREDERAADPCIASCAASNYERGRADALAEARDAVFVLLPADYEMNACAAIDAIDALRGER
jgi:hypothetical protein